MDKNIRRDSLTTKLSEAIEKKSTSTPISANENNKAADTKSASQTPSRSVSPNVLPPMSAQKSNASPAKTPKTNSTVREASPAVAKPSQIPMSSSSRSPSPALAKTTAPVTSEKKSPTPATVSKDATPTKTSQTTASNVGTPVKKETLPAVATTKPPGTTKSLSPSSDKAPPKEVKAKSEEKAKASLPFIVTASIENPTDVSPVEPTAEFTISLNGTKKVRGIYCFCLKIMDNKRSLAAMELFLATISRNHLQFFENYRRNIKPTVFPSSSDDYRNGKYTTAQ
ncbi:unnamed protein product [Strongylus vulgaris]|uniref:Uncharacterized protein n=1 Tax=Strongylus vulgaris TaxID=40348 RepID=A0A3P7LPP4_STRVU|nr:unnamed protein product [Strongylus vulgaris]